MELESIVEVMLDKKYMLGMGAKAVASRMSKILNKPCTKDQIKEAKIIAKNRINFGTDYHPEDVAFVESKPTNKLVKHPPEIIINDRRLIIGDLHEPFTLKGYLDFCKSIYDEYDCNSVIFIGDIIDNHFSSFHESDPDGLGAMEELNRAKANIKKWHSVFPNAKVCVGNHDLIPERKLFNAGVSKTWVKSIGEVLDTPTWTYSDAFIINGVQYTHGTGRKAAGRMRSDLTSIVQGHYHAESYIQYSAGKFKNLFAMQIGCGADADSYALAYGKHFDAMHINCGVVLKDGTSPKIEYMNKY